MFTRGTNPTDLSVEQSLAFDFVVDMKTAQALGISFPNEIMLRVTGWFGRTPETPAHGHPPRLCC